ncbi:hypothetical protein [Pseudoroseicyclus aestuarii]|uniref:Uncharacterized protein n=1 Tax=Pseudoroseicyclus aestuarii TaxID=1795041 RepID=A0A318T6H2_9RHOB|nr:hypothetical protein [Pseudoroseicyclus aestuarii]PYE83978.1 hypothetical protein DFP88_103340 [Pseudoroseicyclus aestuarii]
MPFEAHDKQVRQQSFRRAFPVEADLPDVFERLLGRLAEEEEAGSNEAEWPRKQG